jgi:hypothetical protein
MMTGWIALAFESSTLGWLASSLPIVRGLPRFDYPFSTGWHGPVVPYLALATGGLAWPLGRRLAKPPDQPSRIVVAGVALAAVVMVVAAPALLAVSKRSLSIYGAFSSAADLRAMHWIRDNTPRQARILNYPGDYEHLRDWESHWAPVLTERDCVYFRGAPFFISRREVWPDAGGDRNLQDAEQRQIALLAFWRNPADQSNIKLLEAWGINYVLVPEWLGDPASLDKAWRWTGPARLRDARSAIEQAQYLPVVYREGGSMVLEVPPPLPVSPDRVER